MNLAQIIAGGLLAWLAIAYGVMSVAALVAYALDKSAARRGRRRVRERTLHALALLCGWPGALVAQQLFRHKRRKAGFVLVTWLIAAAHVAAWVYFWRR